MTDPNAVNYRQFGDVPLAVITALLTAAKSPMLPTLSATYAAIKGNTSLFFAQAWMENQWETTGIIIRPEDHNPVSLRPWTDDPTATVTGDLIDSVTRAKVGTIKVPPGAIGAILEPDKSMMLRFSSDAAGAREWQRRIITDPTYKGGVYVKAVTLEQMIDIYCPPGDIHPVTGNDADATYAPTVRAKLAEFAAAEAKLAPVTSTGDTTVATTTAPKGWQIIQFPGMTKPLWLPDDIKVTNAPIPDSLVDWVRSGVAYSGQTKSTWHDTGNEGSRPVDESAYLHSGPRDNYGNKYKVGFNGAFGAKEIVFLTPMNEVTWAAGTATGNQTSFHFEQCFGPAIDWDASIYTGAALHAAVLVAYGRTIDDLVEHNYWFGKDCPGQIRHKGLWPDTVAKVVAAMVNVKAAMAGQPVPVDPTAAWPYPVAAKPWFWDDLFVKNLPYAAKKDANGKIAEWWTVSNALYEVKAGSTKRLQRAVEGSNDVVGPPLTQKTQFRGAATGFNSSGDSFTCTPMLTRVDLDDLNVIPEDTADAA